MKLRKIYTSAGILLLSLFCIGDAVAKDAKFETGVSFGSTGADEPYSSLTDKDGNYYISGMCRGDVEFAGGATIKGRGGMDVWGVIRSGFLRVGGNEAKSVYL